MGKFHFLSFLLLLCHAYAVLKREKILWWKSSKCFSHVRFYVCDCFVRKKNLWGSMQKLAYQKQHQGNFHYVKISCWLYTNFYLNNFLHLTSFFILFQISIYIQEFPYFFKKKKAKWRPKKILFKTTRQNFSMLKRDSPSAGW